jgi:hypothetical protein
MKRILLMAILAVGNSACIFPGELSQLRNYGSIATANGERSGTLNAARMQQIEKPNNMPLQFKNTTRNSLQASNILFQ